MASKQRCADAMRPTVTLDPDVEQLLKAAMREREAPFKTVLNDALRQGLAPRRAAARQRYRQLTFDLGRPLVDLTKANALAADLEDQALLARLRAAR